MTEQEVMEKFKAAIAEAGGQRAFARQHGVTAGYISDVFHGRRALTDTLLRIIKIKRYRMVIDSYVEQAE